MATATAVPYRIYDLPWSTGRAQERTFWRTLGISCAAALVATIVVSLVTLPQRDRAAVEEIPERFARLVLERDVPPPPPPVVIEQPEPEPEVAEPEPERVVEERVEPEPEIVEPEPEPVETVEQARERASVAGLLPFAAELAALRDNENLDRLEQQDDLVGAADAVPTPNERSLITSSVGAGSGGINTAEFSRNTGGGGLVGRATTQVESPVDGLGPPGGAAQRSGESAKASRSREEIERVFDRNKGAIYALYNRALRENPALEGKVVLRLTINPAGVVTSCEIVSSELADADLEHKLVQRVLLFQFEPKDVETITTTKPIDFFPA